MPRPICAARPVRCRVGQCVVAEGWANQLDLTLWCADVRLDLRVVRVRRRRAFWPTLARVCRSGRSRILPPPVAGGSAQPCRRRYPERRRSGCCAILLYGSLFRCQPHRRHCGAIDSGIDRKINGRAALDRGRGTPRTGRRIAAHAADNPPAGPGHPQGCSTLPRYAPPGQGEAEVSPGRPGRHGPICVFCVHLRFNVLRFSTCIGQRPAG
jgi:hypothetical protein